jgi:hypothetical protein
VALMGPDSLRASVQIGATRLVRATPPGEQDALGGRLARLRDVEPAGDPPAQPPLEQLRDDPQDLPLFVGWSGRLSGFPTLEELVSPGRGEVVAAIGQLVTPEEIEDAAAAERDPRPERPALSVVRQGEGYVIRVGIPAWVERITAGDPDVIQLTRNIVDVLRRVTPRPRSPI